MRRFYSDYFQRNVEVQDPEKQEEIASLFDSLSSEQFHAMVEIGKQITDFTHVEEGTEGDVLNGDTLDEETGVAVEFEGEDDEDDGRDADEIVVSLTDLLDVLSFRSLPNPCHICISPLSKQLHCSCTLRTDLFAFESMLRLPAFGKPLDLLYMARIWHARRVLSAHS